MFTTFHSTPARPAGGRDDPSKTRPKRSQVRRACDWCKLMRIKCDTHRPCSNCQQAGRDCAIGGENQFRSIAEAVKEVRRLRAQVREYESTKKHEEEEEQQQQQQPHAGKLEQDKIPKAKAECKSPSTSSSGDLQEPDASTRLKAEAPSSSSASTSSPTSHTAVLADSIPYGVSSLPFFLSRMNQFLRTMRPHINVDLDLFTGSSEARIPGPLSMHRDCPQQEPAASWVDGFLPRAQEAHFLELFWSTHYFGFPILNEGHVRKEFKALWDESDPGMPRRASPVMDIVLALCIQLGSFIIYQSRDQNGGSEDKTTNANRSGSTLSENSCPSLAGFQYYRRCQETIDQSLESPSIDTVQCYIFSIVYLYEAGLFNKAQVLAGKAVMMGMILGLSHEPPMNEPGPHREVARRTWWSLYILDAKLCMETGRPPLIGPSHSTCQLPSDSSDVARWLGPHYSFDGTCPTWLGFQTQTLKLLSAVRTVRSALHDKYDAVIGEYGYDNLINNASTRENCAYVLAGKMKELGAWTRQVSDGYIVPRKQGQPFSTDRSSLDIRPDVLIHCQRQRLLLELQYHQYCMSLCQPFICFTSSSDMSTPVSDGKAATALNHALTLTNMIHQTLTSSDALGGVYHVFRWQRNALFVMLGYAYTYPISVSTTRTLKAIETAITVVDMYRDILPEARHVGVVVRVLADDVNAIIKGFHRGAGGWSTVSLPIATAPPAQELISQTAAAAVTAPAFLPDEASNKQDVAMGMTPLSDTDKFLDLSFLHEMGEDGMNMEAMDILCAQLTANSGANIDAWATMVDGVAGGLSMDYMQAM